jgi:hypothetical protein
MNRRLLGVALLCGIAAASPAQSLAGQDDSTGAQASEPKPKEEKIICRREQTVGTHFSKKMCLTKSQWKQREQAYDDQESYIRDRLGRTPSAQPTPGAPVGGGG